MSSPFKGRVHGNSVTQDIGKRWVAGSNLAGNVNSEIPSS